MQADNDQELTLLDNDIIPDHVQRLLAVDTNADVDADARSASSIRDDGLSMMILALTRLPMLG